MEGLSIVVTSPVSLTMQYVHLDCMESKVRGPVDEAMPDKVEGVQKELT